MRSVPSTSEPRRKYFSGQFVLRQGTEHCIICNTMLRALCFNLGTAQRSVLQNFSHIHSVKTRNWVNIDKWDRHRDERSEGERSEVEGENSWM